MKNLVFLLFCSLLMVSCDKESADINGNNSSGAGTSGSTASIITYNGFIYTVDNNRLRTLSLENPANPVEVSNILLDESIETIFAYEDHLYLGTRSGVLLFNISDGSKPEFTGNSFHFIAKDPVVVEGNYAFSTTQWGEENVNPGGRLSVIDVTNKNFPETINSVEQEFPGGLALNGDHLYVCNGKFGLNIFAKGSHGQIDFIKNIATDPIYDCIPTGNLLICQAKTGLLLFNITDAADPVFIQKVAN